MPQVPGAPVDYLRVVQDEKRDEETEQLQAQIPTATTGKSAQESNPYVLQMLSDRDRNNVAMKAALQPALTTDPDQYASELTLARETGLPVGAVQTDVASVQNEQRLRRVTEAVSKSPLLQAWMTQDDNAILGMDDADNLSGLESAMRSVGDVAMSPFRGFDVSVGQGIQGLGRLNDAAARAINTGVRGLGLDAVADVLETPIPWWMNPSNWARGAGKMIEDTGGPALPEDRRNLATDVGEGLGTLIGQAVATRFNPTAGVAVMAGQGAEQQGDRAEAAGATQEQTDKAVVLGAAITAASEKLGLDLLLNRLPPQVKGRVAQWLVDKAIAGGIEGTEEAVEQIGNNIVAGMLYDPNAPIFEGVQDSATVGGAVGIIARSLLGIRGRAGEAQTIKSERTALDGMVQAAGTSKLAQRAPERFEALVQQMAQEGATTVYVPAEAVQTLFQSQEPAAAAMALGIPLENYMEAVLTGGDLAIPIESYLTRVAPQHHDALRDVARFTPGAMTPAETEQMEEQAKGAADRFMASVQSVTPSDERVREDVTGMLLGTGRFRREDVEKYAQIMQAGFRTLAAREGQDPFDLYSQYRLRIKSELPAALQRADIDTVIDPLIERLRAGQVPRGTKRQSLADFIAAGGGVKDDRLAGEIETLDQNDRVTRRGKARLVRKDATRDLDRVREAAAEAGYLPEDSDVNDLLALLENEMAGQPTYAIGDEADSADDRTRQAAESLEDELGRRGIDVQQATNAEIKAALFGDGDVASVPDELVQVFDQPAFHGTHDDAARGIDEAGGFKLQKIGTGEGNQAFGWGLYFASIKDVAEQYRHQLSGINARPGAKLADQTMIAAGNDRKEAIRLLQNKKRRAKDEREKADVESALYVMRQGFKRGQTYQVEVPDDGDLLDYDKPLSDQPEKVRLAAMGLAESEEMHGAVNQTGGQFYNSLSNRAGSSETASKLLNQAGITGLRYADGMTRGKDGEQSHNYVIWDENAISEPTKLFQSAGPFVGMTREQFIGNPKITSAANAADLKPKVLTTVGVAKEVPFMGSMTARYSEDGAAVYADGKLIASYNFGDTLVVDKASRREGIAEELVYQWRSRYPSSKPAKTRTKASHALQEKVWARIERERDTTLDQSDRNAEAIRRGYIKFGGDRHFTIALLEKADATTFLHETGHFFLEVLGDLAADPNASADIVRDYDAALKFLGVESREQIGVEQHEKWARAFESYLGEGNAPSAELAPAFARFKAWVKAIYRTLRALNVELTDDVRGVFDRLLATDEEITNAESSMDYAGLFADANSAGWTDAEFATRLQLQEQAREEAESKLMARAMRDVTRETKAWWKERSEEVRAEVTAEVYAMPVYRAWSLLANGTEPDGTPIDGAGQKLDKGWLAQQYGQEWLNKNLLRKRVYSITGGADPDVVALGVGFESGDEMVRELANAQPMEALIRAQTQARMIDQYGDVMTDGTLPEAAQRAVHGDRRFKAMEADLRALERLAGEPRPSAGHLRAVAESIVGRQRVRDLQPNTYLRAERKAAKEAIQASGRQEWGNALEAQRRRLLNAHIFDVASRAKDETEKLQRYIRRFEKPALRARLGKIGRLEQVETLLDQYDMRRISGRQIDRDKARGQLLALIDAGEVVAPVSLVRQLRTAAGRTNWRDLTVEDLRGIRDILRQTEAAARAEYKAYLNGIQVDLDESADFIAASTLDGGKSVMPIYGDLSPDESVKKYGKAALASWLRPSALARLLDGGKDDGGWTRNIIQPIRRAVAEVLEPMKRKATEDLSALYRKHYTVKEMAGMNERSVVPGIGMALSRWDLISLALNWGNVENRKAVLDSEVAGRKPYSEAGVRTALETLDARDWAFVQDAWDYVDSYWPAIKEAQQRRKGISPPKVEADAFVITTRDGQAITLKGGYYPLKYNGRLDAKARQHEMDEAFERMRAGTLSSVQSKYGHVQERVGSGKQPVMLSMNVLHGHINNVVMDLALGDAVNYVDRVLQRPQVRQALIETGNLDTLETWKLWLKDTATGEIGARSGVEQISQFVRLGFTKSKVGFNAMTVVLQLTGLAQTIPVVGAGYTARAALDMAGRPREAIRQVMDQSKFMATRYELNSFNKDIADVQSALRGGAPIGKGAGFIGGFINAVRAVQLPPKMVNWAFFGIRQTQMMVDTTTWLAGYRKATENGKDHAAAVAYADGIVENAQTSGMFSDRSGIERGTLSETTRQSEFVKLWTTLMSYMIAKGNIAFESYQRTDFRSPSSVAAFGSDVILLFAAEVILMAAIKGGWPDDDEDWFTWTATTVGAQAISTIPVLREIPSFYKGFGTAGGPLGATMKDIATAAQQTGQAEVDAQLIKSYMNLIGTATGLPSAQINRAIDAYWREGVKGEDVPAYEYITGKRKE